MRFCLALLAALAFASFATAEQVGLTDVTPNVVVFATGSGNVVASIGPDGALLIGTPSSDSTAEISNMLANRTHSSARYLVVFPEDAAHSDGDAGWAKRGAFVAMQEKALERLGGHEMGPPKPLPPRLLELGVDRPHVAFSEVLTFDLNGEAVHVVHQPPGYSDADSLAHFHVANLVYLGEVFPGDGYPKIDTAQGGKLNGLINDLHWTGSKMRIVPARGKLASGVDVEAFRNMIVAVKSEVQRMADSGATLDQVIAVHPTKEFDAR